MTIEHPILFSGEMVRAILDGRKFQTRRPVKPAMGDGSPPECQWLDCGVEPERQRYGYRGPLGEWVSPFGGPGDSTWVRECWATDLHWEQEQPSRIAAAAREAGYEVDRDWPAAPLWYRADGTRRRWGDFDDVRGKWRPSIHMPRWASRITLEVTAVRVERVQGISDADVLAEGVEQQHIDKNREFFHPNDIHGLAFAERWDAIYADKGFGWAANPWVWVGEFGKAILETKH